MLRIFAYYAILWATSVPLILFVPVLVLGVMAAWLGEKIKELEVWGMKLQHQRWKLAKKVRGA
jgi:hypothetical protein